MNRQIETDRLILRPFCGEDLDIIYRLYSDEEILRYTPFDVMDLPAAKEHLAKIVAAWGEEPVLEHEMAVVIREDGRSIGRCHAAIDIETDTAMIGWFLVQEEWGKGYATEICSALIRYSFEELHVRRVNAVCNPDNTACCRLMEKCGMRLEAHLKEKCRYIKHGEVSWHDEREYAMLASEYVSVEPYP